MKKNGDNEESYLNTKMIEESMYNDYNLTIICSLDDGWLTIFSKEVPKYSISVNPNYYLMFNQLCLKKVFERLNEEYESLNIEESWDGE